MSAVCPKCGIAALLGPNFCMNCLERERQRSLQPKQPDLSQLAQEDDAFSVRVGAVIGWLPVVALFVAVLVWLYNYIAEVII